MEGRSPATRVRPLLRAVEWKGDRVQILDQTHLPGAAVFRDIRHLEEMVEAIRSLRVRGAPLIAVAAAYALALEARKWESAPLFKAREKLLEGIRRLAAARPTAVNLFHFLTQAEGVVRAARSPGEMAEALVQAAEALEQAEVDRCHRIGEAGAKLVPQNARVMTICNTGVLATPGIGTALGVIYKAHEEGKIRRVYALETRPLLQGARLTAFELLAHGVPVTLIPDAAAGVLLKRGEVDLVLVGADRIAANGDTANKIGTYTLAVLASHAGVPFYVAAPSSTFDLSLPSGQAIPIEERGKEEVIRVRQCPVAPEEVEVWNPAFDVTPGELITAFITEHGIIYPPFSKKRFQEGGIR